MTRIRVERAQVAVTSVLVMVAVIAAAAMIVDGGHWLFERRNAQGVADAAALAAVREVATGGSPETVAQEYVDHNAADQMTLDSVTVDAGTVTVLVDRTSASFLAGIVGIESAQIHGRSVARALQASGIAGALPFAFMRDGYDTDTNEPIKVGDNLGPGNRGIVSLQMEPDCSVGNGADDMRDAVNGGACASPEGTGIETETGNVWGPIRQSLDQRIGDNTQSFDDVFQLDETTGRYIVRDVDSPRLGIVPLVENPDGTTEWPTGDSPVVIVGYVLVYIGKTDAYPYPPYSADKTVWVTPVRAVLPDELDAVFGDDFDPDSDSPVTFRLVD